jgi:hypothetical protein
METNANTATYESKSEAVQDEKDFVKLWLDQIERSGADEKAWREDAEKAEDVYRSKDGSRNREFNIFHANIETIVPALYNSTPIPDVRRRFADKDPIGKVVSDIIERSLSFAVDTYDFDGMMHATIKDSEITDRGIARVRYTPYFAGEGEQETLSYAEVTCEHIPWRDFRRGPGRFWGEVPWEAFRHYLSKDEIAKLIDGTDINIEDIPLNYSSDGSMDKKEKDPKSDVFKRGMVWEIWDKDSKKVLFICQDYHERVLKTEPDPLELTNFFPTPKPLQAVEQTASLVPVTPLRIYESLVDELNVVTRRITKLVKTLRPRGLYGGNPLDVKAIGEAEDGDLVPATDAMQFMQNGGLEKAIHWYPLDPTTKAIQTLYEQREAIKQTIYEVTGIADILRGSTDPGETLGAQQLKAQWGSLRIQRRQAEVARFARELFELKAEIIATKFDWPLLSRMTGVELPSQEQKQAVQALMQQVQQAQQAGKEIPPQVMAQGEEAQKLLSQPSQEEVMQLLQDDIARNYRVDIESDSTIRNDLSRNQQTMNLFLQGTAQFGQAMGPIIMADASMKPVVMEIYGAFARQFKLGRQAEDAIESATEAAQKSADQPPPPDPQVELEKQKLAMEKEKMGMELQLKQAEMQLKQQEAQAKIELEKQKMEFELQIKQAELQLKAQEGQQKMELEQAKAVQDAQRQEAESARSMQLEEMKAQQQADLEARKAEQDAAIRAREADAKAAIDAKKAEDETKIKDAALRDDSTRKDREFQEKQAREKQAFENDQKRKSTESAAKIAADDRERRAKAERDEKEREAEKAARAAEKAVKSKQPKKALKVKFIEDKSGNITGAEIED